MSQRDYSYDREKNTFNPAASGVAPNNALCLAVVSNLVYQESASLRTAAANEWRFDQCKVINVPKKPFIDAQFQDGEGTKRYANGNLSACPDAANNSATKT